MQSADHAKLKFYGRIYKLNITFAGQNQKHYESCLDYTAADRFECVHDIRMVRSPQASGNEDLIKLAADCGHTVLMGSGILRILRSGAGQQDRIHRQRRSVQSDAAQGDTGGDFPHGIHPRSDGDVQRSGPTMESFRCILLPHNGRIFRILEIKSIKNHKNVKKNLECKRKTLPLQSQTTKRSVRITVSTQDSQSCNRGSIPLPTTRDSQQRVFFCIIFAE